MESKLEICYNAIIIYLNILKYLKESAKRWWVDPFEN